MIKGIEFFRDELLPTLNQVTSFSATARVLNFDASTVHAWIKESKAAQKRGDDPSEFLFEYDGSTRYLHQHIKAIGRASITDIEANARARARDGYYRPCRFQGRTVFQTDMSLSRFDDATLDMLGIPDRLLRDANGQPVPEMEWVPPSTDLVLAVLAANSETYRKRSAIDISGRMSVTGGVAFLGGPKQPAQVSAPLPMLEIVQEIEEQEGALTDVTDTDPATPVEPADDDEDEEPAPADPGPRISEPTPPEYKPTGNPIIDPAKADALRAAYLRSLPATNEAVRAALKGRTA
jgi:hypothetical protein